MSKPLDTDMLTRTLNYALRLLQVDYPVRLGIGALLGVIIVGLFSMIFPESLSIYTILMCLASGPFLTMAPLIVFRGNSTRESVKQHLDAAELIMDRADFDHWMRNEFYRKALADLQRELAGSSAAKAKRIGVEDRINSIMKVDVNKLGSAGHSGVGDNTFQKPQSS